MDIIVTPQQLAENAQLQQFAVFFLINGGPTKRDPVSGNVTYCFNEYGERTVSQDQFAYLVSTGVKIDKATCYIEMTAEEYAGEVPAAFPESSYTNDQEETVQRVWSEYAPFSTVSTDGSKVLVQCVHVPYGSTCGNGLGAEELPVWIDYFGIEGMITTGQGDDLLRSSIYNIGQL